VRLSFDRAVGLVLVALIAFSPLYASDYFVTTTLTSTLYLGIIAASLIFLSAYGGMVSLTQAALAGIAGFAYGNLVATGGSKGLNLGYSPWVGIVLGIGIATLVGLVFGAVGSRSTGIYFLMITLVFSVIVYYFFGQVTQLSGFGGVQVHRIPGVMGDAADNPFRLFYVTLGCAIFVYVLIRFILRTPFGLALQGVRDEPVRMASLGFAVPLHRTLAFGLAAFIASIGGLLNAWSDGIIAPSSIDLNRTIDILVIAVLGGLVRIEGAWVGAFAFVLINNYIQDYLGSYGDRIRTVVGLIFLAIVIVAPTGLMGLWERATDAVARRRRGGPAGPSVEPAAGQGT
jgi:branched-chain amino acid transport system permease protein